MCVETVHVGRAAQTARKCFGDKPLGLGQYGRSAHTHADGVAPAGSPAGAAEHRNRSQHHTLWKNRQDLLP